MFFGCLFCLYFIIELTKYTNKLKTAIIEAVIETKIHSRTAKKKKI